MALINCPECCSKISEYALACPHCGCPKSVMLARMPKKVESTYCIPTPSNVQKPKQNNYIRIPKYDETSDDYMEYLRYCEEEKKKFEIEETKRLERICFETEVIFNTKDGFNSSAEILLLYTKEKRIRWTYSKEASYFDDDDKTFGIVFVSNTFCILEVRGKKQKNTISYNGYLKLNENSQYLPFPEWKEIYSLIIPKSDYFTIENLLLNLRYKPKKMREANWKRIVKVCQNEALEIEKAIQRYKKRDEYCPISYKRFLYLKYPENWASFGMSGGTFSPR